METEDSQLKTEDGSPYPIKDIKVPHDNDILCGRGTETHRHVGNAMYRGLVNMNKQTYTSSAKQDKATVAKSIIAAIRNQQPPGRFLQKEKDTGLYYDIGDNKAISKTSQALREGQPKTRREIAEKKVAMARLPEAPPPVAIGGDLHNINKSNSTRELLSPPDNPSMPPPLTTPVSSQNNHNHHHNNSSFTDNISNGQHDLQQAQKRPRLGDVLIKQEDEGSQNNHNHHHNNSSFTDDISNGQQDLQQTQKRPRLGDIIVKQEEGEIFEDSKENEEEKEKEKEKETDFHLRDELLQKIANLEMQLDQRSRQIQMYENINNNLNGENKRLTDVNHALDRVKRVLKQEIHNLSEKFEKEKNSILQENNSVKSKIKKLQSENDFLTQENKNLIQLLESRQSFNQPQNMTSSEKQTNSLNSDETNNNSIEQLYLKIEKLRSEELSKAIEALDKKWEERLKEQEETLEKKWERKLNDQKEQLLQEVKKVQHENTDNQVQELHKATEKTNNQAPALRLKDRYDSLLRKDTKTKFLFHEFDSKKIIITTSDEGIKFTNLENGEVIRSIEQRKASFSSIDVTRFNGIRVLAIGHEEDKNMIELWSMENYELLSSFRCLGKTAIFDIKAYEHNGKNMLACVGQNFVELWDLESQKMTSKIHGQYTKVYIMDILRYKKDGKLYIVLLHSTNKQKLLEFKCLDDDKSNFNRMKEIDLKRRKILETCVFEFDNDVILAVNGTQCIIFWRMSDLEQYHVLNYALHQGPSSMESFTLDDGRVLIILSDYTGTVSFFDVAEKKLIYKKVLGHQMLQMHVYKDVDDKFAMVASSTQPEGQLSLFDIDLQLLYENSSSSL